jgi:hypothetical protein
MQRGQAILVMVIGLATIVASLLIMISLEAFIWLGVGLVEIIVGSFLIDESKDKTKNESARARVSPSGSVSLKL